MIGPWLAACDSSPAADPESRASAPSSPAQTAVDVGSGPSTGTCWDVPGANAVDPDHWFDDSPPVPCGEPHTTETVQVLRLDEPTAAAAKEEADLCWEHVRRYVGVDLETWVPWMFVLYLPSKEQIADGASWARCDAAFPGRWDDSPARTTTGSAVSIADDPPLELWACLDQRPTKVDQPFVPCDQPHAYEQTGQLAYLEDLRTYPAVGRLDAEADAQCLAGVPVEHNRSVELTARWDAPEGFERGADIAGACFISSEDGGPLPPRRHG